jgi:hypothetical protein
MHAVFQRGRSMPRDRQSVRGFLVWTGVLCTSLSTGCLRSTLLRQDDGPASRPASSSDALKNGRASSSSPPANTAPGGPADSALALSTPTSTTPSAGPAPAPPAGLRGARTPDQSEAALEPATPSQVPTNPTVAPPTEETPTDKPTPLLDAAIERVTAVTRQQRETLESSPSDFDPESIAAKPVAPGSHNIVPVPFQQPASQPFSPPDTAEVAPPKPPVVIKVTDALAQPISPTDPKDARQPTVAAAKPSDLEVARPEAVAPIHESRGALLDSQDSAAYFPAVAGDVESLGIGKLCLCRKIVGFGLFEPLREPRIKVGKRILLYCEMTGMQYEPREASFASRLSSKIEIGSVQGSQFQWAHELGPAEDVCASRRHDFFVNYVFKLPQSLPPGSYRLRLTQTDLVANRTTSSEIPLEIIP